MNAKELTQNRLMTVTELHPVPIQSPWYHMGIDFVRPIHYTHCLRLLYEDYTIAFKMCSWSCQVFVQGK